MRHVAPVRALLGFLCFLAAASGLPGESVEALLSQAVAELNPAGEPLVVSLGNITYAEKNIGSAFAGFFEEKLAQALADSPEFRLFARDKLEEILEAQELSLSGLTDPGTAVRAGRLKGVQALVGGRYFDEGEVITVHLSLVDVESGLERARTAVAVPRALIPPTVAILPDNLGNALAVIEELSRVEAAEAAQFSVRLWTVRGDGATYRDGEELVIHLFASRDCYVKLYQIDVNKKMQLIFPNRFFPDNFIRASRVYTIPDARYPFRFLLGAPYGTEFVKCIASTVQFEDIESDFEDLGSSSKELITRGLSVQQREELLAEAMISYTIVE